MERTTSRPPQGGGADWALFFAPVAVTAVVILGAVVFVWSAEPEPVDRPEVERVDLSELGPVPESPRLSSVGVPEQREPSKHHPEPKPQGISPPIRDEEFDDEGESTSDGAPVVAQEGREELSKEERVDQAFAEAHEKLNKVPEEMLKHMPVLRQARGIVEERELRRAGVLGEAIEPTDPEDAEQAAPEQSSPDSASSVSEPTEPENPGMGAAGAPGR